MIRDLATNWNINIAHELEEYLDQLENVSIAFPDPEDEEEMEPMFQSQNGGNLLNFAEAALLIQVRTVALMSHTMKLSVCCPGHDEHLQSQSRVFIFAGVSDVGSFDAEKRKEVATCW